MTTTDSPSSSPLESALHSQWRDIFARLKRQPDIIENSHSRRRAEHYNRLVAGVVLGWQNEGILPSQDTLVRSCEQAWRAVDQLMLRRDELHRGTQGFEQAILDATYTWVREDRNGADFLSIYASFPTADIPTELITGFCRMARGRYVQDTDRVVSLAFSGPAGRHPSDITRRQVLNVDKALKDLYLTRLAAHCKEEDDPMPQTKPRRLAKLWRHLAMARI